MHLDASSFVVPILSAHRAHRGLLAATAARAAGGSGNLDTLDRDPSLIPIARRGFAEVGLEHRIALTEGPIGETLDAAAEEMRRAWEAIQARPGLDLVHTLRRVGIVVAQQ